MRLTIASVVLAAVALAAHPAPPATQSAAATAKTWVGRAPEIEAYLRTAPVVRTETTDRGVTKPVRAFFADGGPVASMTWKALPPGRPHGYYESYKSEIAAYELDKLLGLNMVPPKVEREFEGETGVAVMWVDGAKSFATLGGVPRPPSDTTARWNRELVRAKMFHNLVGDIDPNLGNWLVDPAWQIILIDQSRALTTTTHLVHKLQHVDGPLWDRMRGLTEESLSRPLSAWLGGAEIRAILKRRDRMQKEIDRLVRDKGAGAVYYR